MTKLEDAVTELKNDKLNVDDISPLREVVEIIDEELENLEKRRARLLYIRNLAIGATHGALEEVDHKKKQIIHYLVDQGPINIESLSKNFEMTEEVARGIIEELEIEGIVKKEGNIVYLETD